MGGCCGTCRGYRLHGTAMYYHDEELELLNGAASFTESPVHPNSSASSLDTYHHPPMPMHFHADLDSSQFTDSEFAGTQMSVNSFQMESNANRVGLDIKAQDGTAPLGSKKSELELPHLIGGNEEENVCPICFEDYTKENQKVITKCNHQFHLSCIYEWMERSNTCPMCNQEMDFEV